MGRNRPSNEGAPRVPGSEGGPPWGRIVALLIGLILLAVLIPLACQAFGASGDQGSGQQRDQGSGQQKGVDKAASGDDRASASADGGSAGSGTASGGSSKDAQAANDSGGRETAATGSASAGAAGGGTTGASAAGGASDGGGAATGGARVAAGVAHDGAAVGQQVATARIAGVDSVRSADGRTATVPRAAISGTSGWLAVHADENGEPGDVLGHAPLREGTNADVAVPLDRPVDPGSKLYAMVHADEPADGKYTFPNGDPPVVTSGGEAVVESFEYAGAGGSARASVQGAASGSANGAGEPLPDTGGPVIPILAAGMALLMAGGLLLAGGLPRRGPRLASRTSEPDPRAAHALAAKCPVETSKDG